MVGDPVPKIPSWSFGSVSWRVSRGEYTCLSRIEVSERAGVAVDQMTHEGLKEIVVTENSNVLQSLPPNSF